MYYRLAKEDVENDPEYMIGAFPIAAENDWYPDSEYSLVEYCSEQLVYRLVGVAEAYQLHFPSQLSDNRIDRASLRFSQVESLEEQLEFLYDLLNDEEIQKLIARIQRLVGKVIQSNGKLELVFEGP